MELVKLIITILGPFIASYLTFYFAIRGKQKDSDIQTKYELNNVLSNLLSVRKYLLKLENHFYIKFEQEYFLPVPKNYLSLIFLKSGILNEKCFKDLEASITNLKKYDPLIYHELEGIGNRFEFLKKSFIIPLLKTKGITEFNKSLSSRQLTETIAEVNSYILEVAGKLNIVTRDKLLVTLSQKTDLDRKAAKNEMIKEYYDFLIAMMPEVEISFEQFINDIKNPKLQQFIDAEFEKLPDMEIEQLMQVIAENPTSSLQSITAKLAIR